MPVYNSCKAERSHPQALGYARSDEELDAMVRAERDGNNSLLPTESRLKPPMPTRRPARVAYGAVEGEDRGENPISPAIYRDDPWYWLRDDARELPEVLDHLRAENAYTEQQMDPLSGFVKNLYAEHISHLQETDDTPPFPYGKFEYYSRTVKGQSYKIHCRKPLGVPDATEEVVLDINEVAQGHDQCDVTGVRTSPNHTLVVYGVDYNGSETYKVVVRDIATGEEKTDAIDRVSGSIQWGCDEQELFYCTEDEAKRPDKLWRHCMGTAQSEDCLVFHEADSLFYLSSWRSKSGQLLLVDSGSCETTEMHYLVLGNADGGTDPKALITVQPREFKLRYEVEHLPAPHDGLLVWSNKDNALNMRLMFTSLEACARGAGQDDWAELIEYDSTRQIEGVEVFSGHIAVEGRQDGLTQVWIGKIPSDKSITEVELNRVEFPDPTYEAGISSQGNKIFDAAEIRLHYSSLTTPTTWLDMDMDKQGDEAFTTVKQEEVLNFKKEDYACCRMFAPANDGTQIPVSVVYKANLFDADLNGAESFDAFFATNGTAPGGSRPCFLYGYGSYGICIDPGFDAKLLPYLDRGVVYCIAHIRGGGEMGRYWYEEQGKYLNKRNTFSDFINCAEFLIDSGVTTPAQLAIEGRSAGGLLMGATLNQRPDLFRCCVAGVPFVDVCTTMSDPSIPLTVGEWEEWGNPNEAKYFHYMMSYSPLDNVVAQSYPSILITAGLHDPRVPYWEPAKWAAKLRSLTTGDQNDILVKMDLDSGHFSASDRYKYLRVKAFEQAFVLDRIGAAPSKL